MDESGSWEHIVHNTLGEKLEERCALFALSPVVVRSCVGLSYDNISHYIDKKASASVEWRVAVNRQLKRRALSAVTPQPLT